MSAEAAALHPLLKYVEVTGIRLAVDAKGTSSIRYVIVNHSSAELSDVALNVTIRSLGSQPQKPPVCNFKVTVPVLGAYESKEFANSIDTAVHALDVPDWQSLRAEIAVAQ